MKLSKSSPTEKKQKPITNKTNKKPIYSKLLLSVGLGTDVGGNGEILEGHGQWEVWGLTWCRGVACILPAMADLGMGDSFHLPHGEGISYYLLVIGRSCHHGGEQARLEWLGGGGGGGWELWEMTHCFLSTDRCLWLRLFCLP